MPAEILPPPNVSPALNEDLNTQISPEKTSSILDSLKNNPYFSAGFGLVGIGALLSLLRKSTGIAYTIAQKNLTVSMEVTSKDKSYDWVLKWMNSYLKDKSQHISVETFYKKNDQNERVNTSFSFAPSVGIHYFKYKNSWIRAERTRETAVDRNTGSQVEILKLASLGRDVSLFSSILHEARHDALTKQIGKTLIYHAGLGKEWGLFGQPKNKRPFESVTLDEGIADSIRNDVLDFLKNYKWYNDRGVPYRR
jgi:chaperone BCS1